jgi:hypothetical protein
MSPHILNLIIRWRWGAPLCLIARSWLRHMQFPARAMCWLLTAPDRSFSHTLDGLGRWPRPACFAAHGQPLCWNFLYHSRIVLSVGSSVWYMVRNLRCTVTTDSVLENSKTQNAFLSPVHAMFRNDCPYQWNLQVRHGAYYRKKKTWRDSLPTDTLLSAVSVLVVALPSSEFQEGLTHYPVCGEVKFVVQFVGNKNYVVGTTWWPTCLFLQYSHIQSSYNSKAHSTVIRKARIPDTQKHSKKLQHFQEKWSFTAIVMKHEHNAVKQHIKQQTFPNL